MHYDNPWRPLYEREAVIGWFAIAAAAWLTAPLWALNSMAFYWLGALALGMGLRWLPALVRGIDRRERLSGRPLIFIDPEVFARTHPHDAGQVWLGWGFEWQAQHAQTALDLLRTDLARFAPRDPARLGATWIHGLGADDQEITVPMAHLQGHLLVVGTTGCGKTRLFDLLVTQAVLRGEAVVIIDPKGDQGLRQSAQRACALSGAPQRFLAFHPAFPDASVRIDPLRSFTRGTELASRVAALVPSETGNDPFKAFGQMALTHVVQGLLEIGERPTLVTLRRYLEGGAEPLFERVVTGYMDRVRPRWIEHAEGSLSRARDATARVRALLRFYREHVQPSHPSTAIEGLAGLIEHESAHFGKMIASLMPVLVMLTSASLEELLSPREQVDDTRPIVSLHDALRRQRVLYIGLDSLSDPIVGSAIGSLLLADLAAVAGAIYNNEPDPAPANVFVDEAAEVVADPMIQVLNKGRGAGLRMTVATQTFADFAARMGSEDKARQVLGNVNNVIAMRVLDAETQQYLSEGLPQVRLRTIMETHGATTTSTAPLLYTGNAGQRLMEEEAPLFPAALLAELPNFEYLARVSGGRVIKGRLPFLGQPHLPALHPPQGTGGTP
ncbi:MAG: DUF87 domain-containing protein [Chromatiaceae bacterium]|nr:MAG: DUF87 domain-containing protein [Chromatiaceae bacterium]